MNEITFSIASLAGIVAWFALGVAVLAPAGQVRALLLAFAGRFVPVGFCLLYAYLLVTHWGSAPGGGFSSLAAVLALFSVPGKMLGAWIHFLAFDLLVGRWIVDDVLESGRPPALAAGCPASDLLVRAARVAAASARALRHTGKGQTLGITLCSLKRKR